MTSYVYNNTPTLDERFSVWQFLLGDTQEKVCEHVGAEEAVKTAYHYTHNVATMAGITQRVIIVDGGDCIVFEWLAGKGVVFPTQEMREDARGHRKYAKEQK